MRTKGLWTRRDVLLALGALPASGFAGTSHDIDGKRTGGPYVPTPQVVVDEMLRMGRVGPADFVLDLGSGDGVIVLTAAQRFQARGFGVDIDPDLVARSNHEAKRRGLAGLAEFRVQDVFQADLRKATVLTLYLLPDMMMKLKPKLLAELKPGTRVVSHDYGFGNWPPDDHYTWDVPEKEAIIGVPRATVYLWVVPAKVAGRWQVRPATPGAKPFELALRQQFQNVDGTATLGPSRSTRLALSRLRGDEITFALAEGSARHVYTGRVSGDTMTGTARPVGGSKVVNWSATRIES